jgi:hypothetical protein
LEVSISGIHTREMPVALLFEVMYENQSADEEQ